jgi:NNP family nitrate/nitrite transporter-like MFS transporter
VQGGITFVVIVSLYDRLRADGLPRHSAWRAAFAIVPVPILLATAALVLIVGTDHPAGKWNQRHTLPATALSIAYGHEVVIDRDEKVIIDELKTGGDKETGGADVSVHVADVNVREAENEKRKLFFPHRSLITLNSHHAICCYS